MAESNLFQHIAIVLVRPAGPLNLGAVARAMKNTGFRDLVLINPTDPRSREAYLLAASSREILDSARTVPDLKTALSDRQTVFGVTARPRHKRPRLTPAEAAEKIEQASQAGEKIALVFGPEDRGLAGEEIDLCEHLVGIPSHPDLPSFNLAQAVLLVCHGVFQRGMAKLEEAATPYRASHDDRSRLEEEVVAFLAETEYLTPNREGPLRDMIKRLVYRTDLETRDVRHLLAAIRHIRINWGPGA